MKILKLRLENLASLQGKVEIDFTRPAFADSGIFLITGATGSGKSTLLDAICLALYHRTPRQDRVNKSVNELMTRGASSCMAEVEFDVAGKGYRASFNQRRARDKADGGLQLPQVELAHLGGTVISSTVNEKLTDIEKITGLDFERFTRSILLAQGAFATFLQAKPTEMAALLEELTGTEIYARLSEAAYQQARASELKLKELKDRLSGIQFLDAMARESLECELESALQQVAEGEQLRKMRQAEAHAWSTYQRLTSELETLDSDWAAMELTRAEHENNRFRLTRAERAVPVQQAQSGLQDLQGQYQRHQQAILAADQALRTCREDIAARQASQSRLAQVAMDARNEAERRQHRVHTEIQPLDQALAELSQRLVDISAERASFEQAQAAEAQKVQTLTRQLASLADQVASVEQNIETVKVPDHWLTDWSGVDALNRQCDEVSAELTTLQQQLSTDQQNFDELSEDLAVKGDLAQAMRRSLDSTESQLAEARQGRDEWLGGRTSEALNAALDSARSQRETLASLGQRQTEFQALTQQHADVRSALAAAQENATLQKTQKARCESELAQARERLKDKQTLRDQQRQIQKLEHLRHQLVEGEACPLCGGLEHPFAQQLPEPRVDEAERVYQEAAQRVEQSQVALQTAIGQEASADADQKSCETQLRLMDSALEKAQSQWQSASQVAGVVAGLRDAQSITDALSEADSAIRQADADIKALFSKEREIQAFQDLLQQQRKEDEETRSAFEAADRKLTGIKATQTQRQQLLERQQNRFQTLRVQLSEQLGGQYLAAEADDRQRRSVVVSLGQQVARRRELERQKQHLHTQHTDTRRNLEVCQTQLKLVNEQADQSRQKQAQLICQQNERREARRQLLALEIDAKSWLDEALQSARQTEQANQSGLNALQALTVQEAECVARSHQLQERQVELTDQVVRATVAYERARTQAGFADEPAFEAACLPEGARQDLKQVVETYAQQRQTLSTRREQKQTEQASAQKGLPDSSTPESVQQALAEAGAIYEQAVALQATLKEKREADDRARSQNASLLREREQLEQEHLWLERLDDLIGSAKGDKFRRFAQGLTLDNLLVLANQRLADLHGRYLLRRREDQELALEVLDGWQGDAPRDTSTLSGGESFLVSLALALGLSDLVSERPIDSLFLDEGFGTLDADTLEVALNALDQLHARGKMIGVISHVEALKERIQVQIRLRAAAGAGVSRVELP